MKLRITIAALVALVVFAPFAVVFAADPVAKPETTSVVLTPKMICDHVTAAEESRFSDKGVHQSKAMTEGIKALKALQQVPLAVRKLAPMCTQQSQAWGYTPADEKTVQNVLRHMVKIAIAMGVDVTKLLSEQELNSLAAIGKTDKE